jgi:hypothetical protein
MGRTGHTVTGTGGAGYIASGGKSGVYSFRYEKSQAYRDRNGKSRVYCIAIVGKNRVYRYRVER